MGGANRRARAAAGSSTIINAAGRPVAHLERRFLTVALRLQDGTEGSGWGGGGEGGGIGSRLGSASTLCAKRPPLFRARRLASPGVGPPSPQPNTRAPCIQGERGPENAPAMQRLTVHAPRRLPAAQARGGVAGSACIGGEGAVSLALWLSLGRGQGRTRGGVRGRGGPLFSSQTRDKKTKQKEWELTASRPRLHKNPADPRGFPPHLRAPPPSPSRPRQAPPPFPQRATCGRLPFESGARERERERERREGASFGGTPRGYRKKGTEDTRVVLT